jgi:hypothetical protein
VLQPSPGARDQGKGLQGCEPRRKPKVTQHIPGIVGECEGMNLYTSKESHFKSWSPSGLPNFQKTIIGVKPQGLEAFLISLESSWNADV